MESEFKTGDLVLCKVGAFAPWPAVVFPQRFLSKDVYRKRKQNCVAVCFFNDPTYYWEYIHKLKPLSKDDIEKVLKGGSSGGSGSGKGSLPRDLLGAYKLADRFSSLRTFMRNKFRSEGRLNEFNDEVLDHGEVEDAEDPFLGKAGDPRNVKGARAVLPVVVPKAAVDEPAEEDPEISEVKSEDDKTDSTTKRANDTASHDRKHKMHNKLDRSRRLEISTLFRRRIQRNLIQRDTPPGPREIAESHKLLQKIIENLDNDPAFFDLETLKKTKLHKLLRVINADAKLAEFHEECATILKQWIPFIAELKREKESANAK